MRGAVPCCDTGTWVDIFLVDGGVKETEKLNGYNLGNISD